MESVLSVQKGFEELANQTFRFDKQAIGLLGIRTAVVVATILAIPDAIALIPSSSTVTAWFLSLIGCWVTALVLWFVFFVGFLRIMRLVTGGVQVGPAGVKLWRYGRLLPWDAISAIAVEDEGLFSRLFSFERKVKRLTLFTHIKSKSDFLRTIAVPHYVASFYFSERDFRDLCKTICTYRFQFEHGDIPVLLAPQTEIAPVRKAHGLIRWQRFLISLLIALSIGMFLSRKAIVLYSYNEGQKAFRAKNYAEAEERFLTSVSIEKTFAPAWHGLASSEFHLGQFAQAQEHWKEALRWKPDFVEAKVSLAYMNLQQRNFDDAEKLITSALALAPANPTALLNRADLNLRTGHVLQATQDARLVVAQTEVEPSDRDIFMATCLLAQAKLLQGKPTEAAAMLAPLPVTEARLGMGENLTYRLLVGAQIALALGQTNKAERLARLAVQRGANLDSLLVLAQVKTARKEYDVAQTLLEKCRMLMPTNPWIYIRAGELNLDRDQKEQAFTNLQCAEQCKPMDALSLSRIADLYCRLGKNAEAVTAAKLALQLEENSLLARAVLEQLEPSGKI